MVNILIADDNVDYAISLMNYINKQNNKIRVCNIARDGKEAIHMLNTNNDIDIILLDYKMPFYNGKHILDNIQNKDKYIDSCVVISGEIDSIVTLRNNNLVHSVLFKTLSMSEINNRIIELVTFKENKNIRDKILNELLYLNYDISHKGTQYLVSTIEYIYLNNTYFDNLERYVYPTIAKLYNDTPNNVKCRINKETDLMYYNCEINKLKNYFHLNFDTKPKVKYVITIIMNNIQKL